MSEDETPWMLHCPIHGKVYMTHEEYVRQMGRGDTRWLCPHPQETWPFACYNTSEFDDANWEKTYVD